MPKFNVRVPHSLPQAEAKQRLDGFANIISEKLQDQVSELEQSWEGDTLRFRFKTYGIPLSGGITVEDKQLVLDGDLPVTAMLFKGKIESSIYGHLAQLVAPAGD